MTEDPGAIATIALLHLISEESVNGERRGQLRLSNFARLDEAGQHANLTLAERLIAGDLSSHVKPENRAQVRTYLSDLERSPMVARFAQEAIAKILGVTPGETLLDRLQLAQFLLNEADQLAVLRQAKSNLFAQDVSKIIKQRLISCLAALLESPYTPQPTALAIAALLEEWDGAPL